MELTAADFNKKESVRQKNLEFLFCTDDDDDVVSVPINNTCEKKESSTIYNGLDQI
jgi:hypothetical protein